MNLTSIFNYVSDKARNFAKLKLLINCFPIAILTLENVFLALSGLKWVFWETKKWTLQPILIFFLIRLKTSPKMQWLIIFSPIPILTLKNGFLTLPHPKIGFLRNDYMNPLSILIVLLIRQKTLQKLQWLIIFSPISILIIKY